jgi:two-component system sensor histidine kinase UhpB
MRERALLLGAALDLTALPEGGTRLRLTVPTARPEPDGPPPPAAPSSPPENRKNA